MIEDDEVGNLIMNCWGDLVELDEDGRCKDCGRFPHRCSGDDHK